MSIEETGVELVGIIRIERVSDATYQIEMASTGKPIFIDRHNGKEDGFSVWTILNESWALSNDEWENVLKAYLPWKRQRIAGLKFNRGKRRDGGVHPFRRAVAKGTKRL